MGETISNAKRGGFIYAATLLLFLAVFLIGREILSVLRVSDTAFYAVNSLYSVAAFLFAAIFYARAISKKTYTLKFNPFYVIPSFLLAAGMLCGAGFLNSLIAQTVKSAGGVVSEPQIPLETPFQYVLFTVCLCLLPAVSEELFFRGVLTDSLSGVSAVASVFTVSLCFSLYHGNVAQIVYQFVYGIGLGFLALKAKSIIPSVIAHFLNNFAVLSIEYFKIPINLNELPVIAVGLTLLAGFVLFMIFFGEKPILSKKQIERIKDFYVPFGIVGIAVCVIIIVLSALPLNV